MRRLYFLGVSTGSSSIRTILPAWADELGLPMELVGIDLSPGCSPDQLRAALAQLTADPTAAGALVTTHKTSLYEAARDRFDVVDEWAELCQEISCIALRDGALLGWAKDPITARQALSALGSVTDWAEHRADVVCLGAGGAGLALSVAILGGDEQPQRYVLVDNDARRLEVARDVLGPFSPSAEVDLVLTASPRHSDALVQSAAAGSLIVNATGLGKDRPGSPLSDQVVFPPGSTAWDMNYRGDLRFLRQAAGQDPDLRVALADGWRYFLHGWTEVIAEVFGLQLDDDRFEALRRRAELVTGRTERVPAGAEAGAGQP